MSLESARFVTPGPCTFTISFSDVPGKARVLSSERPPSRAQARLLEVGSCTLTNCSDFPFNLRICLRTAWGRFGMTPFQVSTSAFELRRLVRVEGLHNGCWACEVAKACLRLGCALVREGIAVNPLSTKVLNDNARLFFIQPLVLRRKRGEVVCRDASSKREVRLWVIRLTWFLLLAISRW